MQITIKEEDSAMVVAKLAHLELLISEVDLGHRIIILASVSHRQIQEADYSVSLLRHPLHSELASLRRPDSVRQEGYLELNRTSQLQVVSSAIQQLLNLPRDSSGLQELPQAGSAAPIPLAVALGLEEEAYLGTITSSSPSRSHSVTLPLPLADSGKTTMHLVLIILMATGVAAFLGPRLIRTTLPSDKRNSQPLNRILSVRSVNLKIKPRPIPILHLEDLVNPSNKTRRLEGFLAPSSPRTIVEDCSGTSGRTITSSSQLEEGYSETTTATSPIQARCLHQSQRLREQGYLETQIHPIPILEAPFLETWEITIQINLNRIKVGGDSLGTIPKISKSLEVSLVTPRTQGVGSLATWEVTIINSNKGPVLCSETINRSSSRAVGFLEIPPAIITTKAPAFSDRNSRHSSSRMSLLPQRLSTPP